MLFSKTYSSVNSRSRSAPVAKLYAVCGYCEPCKGGGYLPRNLAESAPEVSE